MCANRRDLFRERRRHRLDQRAQPTDQRQLEDRRAQAARGPGRGLHRSRRVGGSQSAPCEAARRRGHRDPARSRRHRRRFSTPLRVSPRPSIPALTAPPIPTAARSGSSPSMSPRSPGRLLPRSPKSRNRRVQLFDTDEPAEQKTSFLTRWFGGSSTVSAGDARRLQALPASRRSRRQRRSWSCRQRPRTRHDALASIIAMPGNTKPSTCAMIW